MSSIHTIVPILKTKAASSISDVDDKAVRFVQDTTDKEDDGREVEVSVTTTTQEDDEDSPDSELSFNSFADVRSDQKAIVEEVEDNQEASDDNIHVVVKESYPIVERALIETVAQCISRQRRKVMKELKEIQQMPKDKRK